MKTKLPFPAGILSQNVIAIGKPGSGKSSKLRVLVEHLLSHNHPTTILDPKGDWWGLKLAIDGKTIAFPVVIFGGDHADIPLSETDGALLAEIVAAGNRSCIIDLGGWMPSARSKFFVDFASALFRTPHAPMHLVVDECHNFAPQGKVLDPLAGKSLHWANRLASEGRSRGITILAATQRPQKVHKDFLTTCETLIGCRVIHKLDRDAVKDWIDGCADPALGKQVMNDLAGMPRNEAWVWSPEIGYGPVRLAFPFFTSFDSFSPLATFLGPLPPALGLDEIRKKLVASVKSAEDNDPKKLRATIAELQKQLRTQKPAAPIEGMFTQSQVSAQVNDAIREYQAVLASAQASLSNMRSTLAEIQKMAARFGPDTVAGNASEIKTPELKRTIQAPAPRNSSIQPAVIRTATPSGKPEKRVLNALAWWAASGIGGPFTKTQVAAVAGYSPTSGNFANILSKLKASGLVDYPSPGYVLLSSDGEREADPVDAPTTAEELQRVVFGILKVPQQRVMGAILKVREASKEEIAVATEYSASSGNFANLLSSLRSLDFIDYPRPGMVRASNFLYLEN